MKVLQRFALILALATVGCASASSASAPSRPREDRNKITAEQIAKINANNAYEAVRQLQPQWMEDRGVVAINSAAPTAVVYIDGSRMGDLENLRSVASNNIFEIRYLDAAAASNRYGMGLQRGVIEVITKH